MGIPDHFTCLLRKLYLGQGTPIRTGCGTVDWFKIGKGVYQYSIFSPCLFNLHAECIMRNVGLDKAQAGIKIAGRNINNLRCADDTTLMAESEEELKSLVMKVKEVSERKWKSLSHVRLFTTSWNSPWNSPGQSTGVGSHWLLPGIFPTQGSNLGLPHCRQRAAVSSALHQLSHQGSI